MSFAAFLIGLQNWQAFTNTNHISDLTQFEEKLYLASWGGLMIYDPLSDKFEQVYTTLNGLSDNNLRTLEYFPFNDQLLLGTATSGLDRFDGSRFLMPISETLGLADKKVNEIVQYDSLLFIATKSGLSVFREEASLSFPLLLNNYDSSNQLAADNITALAVANSGHLFVGSYNGLDYVHIDSLQIDSAWQHLNDSNSSLPSSEINDIAIYQNIVLVGTKKGIAFSCFPNLNWIIKEEDFFQNETSSLFPVFIDSEFNFWSGAGFWSETEQNVIDSTNIALFRFNDQTISIPESFSKDEIGLFETKIMGMEEIEKKIYFYTWGEGFFCYDLETEEWSSKKEANCLNSNLATELTLDADKNLWLANGQLGVFNERDSRGVSVFKDEHWQNFTIYNSPLQNNDIMNIEIDGNDRKWFGSWGHGFSRYDEKDDNWEIFTAKQLSGLSSNSISLIKNGLDDNMWIGSYPNNIVVMDQNDVIVDSFKVFEPAAAFDFSDFLKVHIAEEKIVFGMRYNGIRIWNHFSRPQDNGEYWIKPPSVDVATTQVYDITSRRNDYGTEEIWIAAGSGLYMFDGIDWFKYGTSIKKKVWLNNSWYGSEDNPNPEYWYYEGQERLYGSQSTYPTALFVDPFNRVWIGTASAGITIFDVEEDTFTNITMDNSALLANIINDLVYNEITGTLYIGTTNGLNTVEIGIAEEQNTETELNNVIAFPNPFYPEKNETLQIKNQTAITMPLGKTKCRIYNLNGELIRILDKDIYEQFSWDGTNKAGKKCSSGMYFFLISTEDGQIKKGKIALIR